MNGLPILIMVKLTYTQKRIRACDRILRHEYWVLKHAIREHVEDVKWHDYIQGRINYFEEVKERQEVVL